MPALVEARGLTQFGEIVGEHAAPNGGNLGHVRLVRANRSDQFIREPAPEAQGHARFESILEAPSRSSSGNLGRVKLIRAYPRDPFQGSR